MTDLDTQIQDIMTRRLDRLPGGGIDPVQVARALDRLETALGRLETAEQRLERFVADAEARGPRSTLGSVAPGPRCRRCQGTGVLSEDRDRGSARIACPRCDGEGTGHVC